MSLQGEQAVQEIIEKIARGEYRMILSKVDPLQRLYVSADSPKGQWIPLKKYHRNTIRAAQRRLAYRYDQVAMQGVYEVAV
jgi:hypothetical protein